MKNLITLLVISIFFGTTGIKNDYIRIEYIGNMTKPMPVLWISKAPLPDSDQIITIRIDKNAFKYNCIVSNDEFRFIQRTIESTKHKAFEKQDNNGFKITIRENDTDTFYFISRRKSTSLFHKASTYLEHDKKNQELIRELHILRYLNVYDDRGWHVEG